MSHGCNEGKRILACHICYDNDSLAYCDFCHNASNLFGCIGLKRKSHCILNTQYAKEEYEVLLGSIIQHMQREGTWGEFFPMTISPFAYNETTAQEYYPLTKEKVLSKGLQWKDAQREHLKVTKTIPADALPDSIDDIPDDVLNWAIECSATKIPFRVTKQELAFYRTMRVPLPRLHPDERHRLRMAYTNPRKLWQRKCAKCGKGIETTYAPERPEIVYCEECYLHEVY